MKQKISLAAILTIALVTPTLSLAHDRDHQRDHDHDTGKWGLYIKSIYGEGFYKTSRHASDYREARHHHASNRHAAHELDRKGDRIDRRLDHKGKMINRRLDRAAHRAWLSGDYQQARKLDRQGDKIERHLDRKGDRINQKLDRKAERAERFTDRHSRGSYYDTDKKSDREHNRHKHNEGRVRNPRHHG